MAGLPEVVAPAGLFDQLVLEGIAPGADAVGTEQQQAWGIRFRLMRRRGRRGGETNTGVPRAPSVRLGQRTRMA